jgi:hypothetical protein
MLQKSQDTRQLGRPPMGWLVSEWALDTGSQGPWSTVAPIQGEEIYCLLKKCVCV